MKRVLMFFFACVLTAQSLWAQQAQLFSPMKDFTHYDRKGNEHKVSEFKGKYIVLMFTSQDCEPCKEAKSILDGFYNRNKDKAEVIAISADDKDSWLKEDSNVSFHEWNDYNSAHDIGEEYYGLNLCPLFVIIHPNGNIIHISKARLGGFFRDLNENVPDAEIENILKGHKKQEVRSRSVVSPISYKMALKLIPTFLNLFSRGF